MEDHTPITPNHSHFSAAPAATGPRSLIKSEVKQAHRDVRQLRAGHTARHWATRNDASTEIAVAV